MNLILKRYSQPDQQIQKLLLTADPDEQKINEYLTTGVAYAAYYQSSLVGTVVLLPQTANQIELVNLAVIENLQQQGIGHQLLKFAIEKSRLANYSKLTVGTGSTSFNALALYQKLGFRIVRIDQDYFSENYSQKIIENGIHLRDRLWLELLL